MNHVCCVLFPTLKLILGFSCFVFSELLAGCRCIGTCTSNYGKSVPKLIMGNSIQCCRHPHCRWSTPSTIWFCHDAFTFRSAVCIVLLLNPSYSLIGMVKKSQCSFFHAYLMNMPCLHMLPHTTLRALPNILFQFHERYTLMFGLTGGLMALSSIFVVTNSLLLQLHGSQRSSKN